MGAEIKERKKGTIIRPGQRVPFKKATNEQIEERVTEIEMMLGRAMRRGQIVRVISEKHVVDWRTVDSYISRARENMLKRLNKTREEHRYDGLTFYESVILSNEASIADKIRARQRIDEMLGLDSPRAVMAKIDVGGEAAREVSSTVLESLQLVYGKEVDAVIEAHSTVKRLPDNRTGSIDPVEKTVKLKPKLAFA